MIYHGRYSDQGSAKMIGHCLRSFTTTEKKGHSKSALLCFKSRAHDCKLSQNVPSTTQG